jgi:hypothetical protein
MSQQPNKRDNTMRNFTRQQDAALVLPQQHNLGQWSPNIMDTIAAAIRPTGPPGGGAVSPADGSTCPQCPPGIDINTWLQVWRRFGMQGCAKLCNLSGGTPALGFGGMCPAPTPPTIERDANGCAKGWLQCKQSLGVTSLAVAGAAIVPVTVTPRRVFKAYQFYYHGAANSFVITSINVDGVEYLGSAVGVNADRYNATVTDHSIDIGEFSSTTPLIMSVQNITAGALDFRGTLDGSASRS